MSVTKTVKFADEVSSPQKAWQDPLNTSAKALSFLLTTGHLSDITFAVGRDGKQFRVHRLILATRSPVLEQMLVYETKYSSSDDVIPVRDDPVGGFQWLMDHIYSDRVDIDNLDMALDVLGLSEKYMVASAYDVCIRYLRTAVKRNNVLALYRHLVTSRSDNDALFDICRKILASNANAVLLSPTLLRLPATALSSLLQETLTVTSEVVIFKAVLSWGTSQLKFKNIVNNTKNLRNEVDAFIKEIRFFTMTSEEFVQNVLVADVLSSDEVVVALKQIARPNTPLPSIDLLNDGMKLCPSRESRPQLITKDRTRTCTCDGIARNLLKHRMFEFHMTTSDNIVLLGFKLQLQDEAAGSVMVELSKDESPNTLLGSTESSTGTLMFRHPVHLRESVGYAVRIGPGGVGVTGDERGGEGSLLSLYGAEHNAATFTEAGVTLTLAPGVFVQSIIFV